MKIYTGDELEIIAVREFPFRIDGLLDEWITPPGRLRDLVEHFGERAASIIFDDSDSYFGDYYYNASARWILWRGARFRDENDAVECKLRFG